MATVDGRTAARLRRAEGYEPKYDIDKAFGDQGELLVLQMGTALAKGDCEVKHDDQWQRTGNLYVEFQCRGYDGVYRKSGVLTSEATLWVFVLGESEGVFIIPRFTLLTYCKHIWDIGKRQPKPNGDNPYLGRARRGSHPTLGFIVSVQELLKWLATESKKATL